MNYLRAKEEITFPFEELHGAVKTGKLFTSRSLACDSSAGAGGVSCLFRQSSVTPVRPLLEHLDARVPTNVITWVYPDVPRLDANVLDLMRASSGELNFNDALIALTCRERAIPAIVSFNADFDQVSWLRRWLMLVFG